MCKLKTDIGRHGNYFDSKEVMTGIYILAILSQLKEEFEGDLKKGRERGGRRKKEKSDKIHVKIHL